MSPKEACVNYLYIGQNDDGFEHTLFEINYIWEGDKKRKPTRVVTVT